MSKKNKVINMLNDKNVKFESDITFGELRDANGDKVYDYMQSEFTRITKPLEWPPEACMRFNREETLLLKMCLVDYLEKIVDAHHIDKVLWAHLICRLDTEIAAFHGCAGASFNDQAFAVMYHEYKEFLEMKKAKLQEELDSLVMLD